MLCSIWECIRGQDSSTLKYRERTSKALGFLMRMEINQWINAYGRTRKKVIASRQDSTLITLSIT